MIVLGDKVKTSPEAHFMPAHEGRVVEVYDGLYHVEFTGVRGGGGTFKLHELEEPPYSTTESGFKIIFPVGTRVHVKPLKFLALRLTSYTGTVTVVNDGGYTVLFDNGMTEDGLAATWLEAEPAPAPFPKMGDIVRLTDTPAPFSEARSVYGADQGEVIDVYTDPAYGVMCRVRFSRNRVDEFVARILAIVPPDERYSTHKTAEEVEALKRNWLYDPCWDIEDTPGFEEYAPTLKRWREQVEEERTREHRREQSLKGELPYIKIGKIWLRADSIEVVEDGLSGRLFVQKLGAGEDEAILFEGMEAERLRAWLNAQAYDLAGEDYE